MEKELSSDLISLMIGNLIGYSESQGGLIEKYEEEFYLDYFDRMKIDEATRKVPHSKELEVEEFVRVFLDLIYHTQEETIYLTMSLIQLFKRIKEQTNNEKGIKLADFTTFLCQKISEGDPDLIVPMKEVPMERMIPDITRIREIDLSPPTILSKVEPQRPKITKNKNKKDKKLEQKKPMSKFIYSHTLNSIIALGRLSSSITLYNPQDLKIKYKITPSACKIMSKDVAILSIAFCERTQRIGCIINNIGITFWQGNDNFTTEKILGVNKSDHDPTICGDKIYYLSLFNEWITTDKNSIYYWDLQEEVITHSLHKANAIAINDICQINHLRSMLVSYTLLDNKQEEKCLILYHQSKQISRILLGNPGSHSLCYNITTQLVISLGYQSSVMVYEIDASTYDIHLIRQLKGHTSILTCISNIPETPMILTGDDIGNIKIWELNYMRCLQSIKIAKNLIQVYCNGRQLIFADSRLNTMLMDNPLKLWGSEKMQLGEQILQENCPIYQFIRKQTDSLWIVTQKQARQISIKSGKIKNIYILCTSDEEISTAVEVNNGIVIGTSKGELIKYGFSGDVKWKISAHQGAIHCIRVDLDNKLIATIGNDNNFLVWNEKNIQSEDNIKKKIIFNHKDIKYFDMCSYRNLIIIASIDCKVSIWDYQTIKLHYIVELGSPITAIKIVPDRPTILLCTADGFIHVYNLVKDGTTKKFSKKETLNLKVQYVSSNDDEQENMLESKYYKQDETSSEKEQKQQSIPTQNQAFYISTVSIIQSESLVLFTNNLGYLHCFHLNDHEPNPNYKKQYNPSPNLKRPIRCVYENQVLKNQHSEYNLSKGSNKEENVIVELWSKKIHKESILSTSVLEMRDKYLCSLCSDGYCKITQVGLENGEIIGSLKITYPLPVKWNITISRISDIKECLHETIVILDTILKNANELSHKEQKLLNISQFLQKMLMESYTLPEKHDSVRLIHEEYSRDDIKRAPIRQTSLKTLEAYKRLQLIKKQNKPDLSFDNKLQHSHYETPFLEKQAIRNYLSPNYLPKLLNKGMSQETNPIVDDIVKKLTDMLQKQKIFNKTKKNDKQNMKTGMNSFKKMHKNADMDRKHEKTMHVENKSVRMIIGQINSKLKNYKKKKYAKQNLLEQHSTI